MGEAMLFSATWRDERRVQLGKLVVEPRAPASIGRPGDAVILAVRPEAWQILRPGEGQIDARVLKAAYLGNTREYSFDTVLGSIFVVTHDLANVLEPGDSASLRIAGPCSVVEPDPPGAVEAGAVHPRS
jgi:iron(III) transport system ATP-binding protein